MDWATFTSYFDWWFFIGALLLTLSFFVAFWHKLNIPLLLSASAISILLAIWGANFYDLTMAPAIDAIRYGGSFGFHNIGSLIYLIGFLMVVSVAAINIFTSTRGKPRVWK